MKNPIKKTDIFTALVLITLFIVGYFFKIASAKIVPKKEVKHIRYKGKIQLNSKIK